MAEAFAALLPVKSARHKQSHGRRCWTCSQAPSMGYAAPIPPLPGAASHFRLTKQADTYAMTRPSGPLRTVLLFLTAGATSLLLGFAAMTVSSALGAPVDQDLGDAVVLDPATVTAPAPTPAPRRSGTGANPLVGGGSTPPSRAPAPAPAPAPNSAPNRPARPAPAPAPAPATTHVPDHQPEQVVPVPPSSADGEHHRG